MQGVWKMAAKRKTAVSSATKRSLNPTNLKQVSGGAKKAKKKTTKKTSSY